MARQNDGLMSSIRRRPPHLAPFTGAARPAPFSTLRRTAVVGMDDAAVLGRQLLAGAAPAERHARLQHHGRLLRQGREASALVVNIRVDRGRRLALPPRTIRIRTPYPFGTTSLMPVRLIRVLVAYEATVTSAGH
jgi:hypothetical protein